MPIDYATLMNWPIPTIRQRLVPREAILYALAVGLGGDPLDPVQLRFVREDGLLALPTMAVVLAYPGFWIKEPGTGVDWVRVVHGEQRLTLHAPLPVEGELIGESRVTGLVDKGAGRGAILYSERTIRCAVTGRLYATLEQSTICRSDGGFGGPPGPTWPVEPVPERAPDAVCDLPTLPQQALLYRLLGDLNPLHADPAVAREAGFDRPILHGLCTFGVVGHALLRTCCFYDPARIRSMRARFSAPVFPGETIRTEIWREADEVAFRAQSRERGIVVLDHGRLSLAGP